MRTARYVSLLAALACCTCGAAEPATRRLGKTMKITVGAKTFVATLEDNAAAAKLREMLPLTLEMRDVNANEKYSELAVALPADVVKPGRIRAGDLMLWGGNGLVLFYKAFDSPYPYTRLGRLDDASGLGAALGAGTVRVAFAAQ